MLCEEGPTVNKGRQPATGRFETRAELVDFIWREYLGTARTITDVARAFAFSFGASLTLGLAVWFYLEMWK